MIPLSDDNPTRRTPLVTILLLGLIAAAWVFAQGAGLDPSGLAASVCNLGLVAGELTALAPVGTAVAGKLRSTPGTSFTIDFYASAAADPSGHGEGERWLGSMVVTSNPAGITNFADVLPAADAPEAHRRLEAGGVRGRIVLDFA